MTMKIAFDQMPGASEREADYGMLPALGSQALIGALYPVRNEDLSKLNRRDRRAAEKLKNMPELPLTKLINVDCPDPSFIEAEHPELGPGIILYGTRAHGGPRNIQAWFAPDWHGPWTDLGGAIRSDLIPDDAEAFWAPSKPVKVTGEDGKDKYRLYYTTDGKDGLGIAMAEGEMPFGLQPAPKLVHQGAGYAVIDPHVVNDSLYWGSMHEPIRCQSLAANGYEFDPGSQPKEVLKPGRTKFDKLAEGFFLEYIPERAKWVAFTSGKTTWEWDKYGVKSYEANSPYGPFKRTGLLAGPNAEWGAPGQNCIGKVAGEWYCVMHAVDPQDPYIGSGENLQYKRVPCVARIAFEGGKPELRPLESQRSN